MVRNSQHIGGRGGTKQTEIIQEIGIQEGIV